MRSAQNRSKLAGIDQKTIVVGGFFHLVLHEVSHAIFHQFKTPIFGREEDAAYVVLNLEKSDRDTLITAAIYLFANEASVIGKRKIDDTVVKKRFARAVNSGALPRDGAVGCADEYTQTQNAYRKLSVPYIDLSLGRKIKQGRWLSLAL